MNYAQQRASELGLSEEANTIQVWMPETTKAGEWNLLSPDNGREDNMLILHLTLEKRQGAYVAMSQPVTSTDIYTDVVKEGECAYMNTRLKSPKPGQAKYLTPAGVPAQPFLTPYIIDAWYSHKPIDTLIIVEGALKALKGCMSGIAVIGINGIWGMREAKSKELHPIIRQVMLACNVKKPRLPPRPGLPGNICKLWNRCR